MKIINVKLSKGRKEIRASLAVCSDRPIEEFISLLKAALNIPDSTILGFKDSEGVLLVPNLICSNPELLRSDDYELILREKPSPSRPEEQFSHIVSEIRIKNRLNDEEFFVLRTWMRENNQMIGQVYHTFLINHDIDGFLEWVLKSSGIKTLPVATTEASETPKELLRAFDERPSTTRTGDRPRTSNQDMKNYEISKTNERYLQVLLDLEAQGLLEQGDVRILKGMILRENFDLLKEFEVFFVHNINLQELGSRLQKLSDRRSLYMERPTSPMPKNNQMQFLTESFLRENLMNREDTEVLKKLVGEENEFVFSAYDVYESDKDQNELIDSLIRAINKRKKEEQHLVRPGLFFGESSQSRDDI